MTEGHVPAAPLEAHRALVLHEQPLVVDLIELTLNHGLFVVRAARSLAEAEAILAGWRPHLSVVDMDHAESTALLGRLGASGTLRPRRTPVLGLTRRGDLPTKLRAFDLGVDDILRWTTESPARTSRWTMSISISPSVMVGTMGSSRRNVRRVMAESNLVDRHVRSLRSKLQNDYRHPRFIATVPGRGYRFIPTFSNAGWGSGADEGEAPRH